MTFTITDAPDRAEVIRLNAVVVAIDAEVASAEAVAAELVGRRQALQDRIDAHDGSRPNHEVDGAALDAIASDPSATVDMDAMLVAIDDHIRAERLWKVQSDAFGHAMTRIGADHDQRVASVGEARTRRAAAWVAFVKAAHAFLMAEFVERFGELRASLLDPIAEIRALRDGHRALTSKHDGFHLDDFKVVIERMVTTIIPEVNFEPGDADWRRYEAARADMAERGLSPDNVAKPMPYYREERQDCSYRSVTLYPAETPIGDAIGRFRASLAEA